DRGQPFLGVVEHRVDIEHHAPERIDPVAHHIADPELRHSVQLRLGHPVTGVIAGGYLARSSGLDQADGAAMVPPTSRGPSMTARLRFASTDRYIATRDLEVAVNAAIALERPLLVKGEPGTGKTVLAEEVARAVGLPLIQWHIKSTTKAA